MTFESVSLHYVRFWSALLIICAAVSSSTFAQSPVTTPSSAAAQPSPTPTLERRFIKDILHDELAVFTSPLHVSRNDQNWLLPLTLSTGALLATDPNTASALSTSPNRVRISNDISYIGSGYGAGGTAAAFYFIGLATHNARARETGLLSGEALIDSSILGEVLKLSTQRSRPLNGEVYKGEFFEGGNSFPSGHALAAWSVATVITNEYRHHPLVEIGAYGLATAVSVARYTGQNHFLGDVLVGSAIGYGVGGYVYRTHHDQSVDNHEKRRHSKLFPSISPQYSGHIRGSGVALLWHS